MKIVRGKIWRAGIYLRKTFRWQKIRPLVSKYGYYAGLAGMEKIIRRQFNLNAPARKEP